MVDDIFQVTEINDSPQQRWATSEFKQESRRADADARCVSADTEVAEDEGEAQAYAEAEGVRQGCSAQPLRAPSGCSCASGGCPLTRVGAHP